MTAADYAAFKAAQQSSTRTAPPQAPGALWSGEVVAPAPTGSGVNATVRAVNSATGEEMTLGVASWPQPMGKLLPSAGDKCLVAVDETQVAWIVAWERTSWPGTSSIESRVTALEHPAAAVLNNATAYRNAAQSTANEAFTQVKLDKAIDDPGKNMDLVNGYYVAPSSGYYFITGQISYKSFFNNVFSGIHINGVQVARGTQTNGGLGSVVTAIIKVGAGQHIELRAAQASGSEQPLEVGFEGFNRLNVMPLPGSLVGPEGPRGPAGTGGVEVFETHHAAEATGFSAGDQSAPEPDKVTFTLAKASLVAVYARMFHGSPGAGNNKSVLYLDGSAAKNENNDTIKGESTPAAFTMMTLANLGNTGTVFTAPGGGTEESSAFGEPANFFLQAGEHNFEVKYNMASAEKKVKERRVIVVVL